MTWSRLTTIFTFIAAVLAALTFGTEQFFEMKRLFVKYNVTNENRRGLVSIFSSMQISGFATICFKLSRSRVVWVHGLLQVGVFFAMVQGTRLDIKNKVRTIVFWRQNGILMLLMHAFLTQIFLAAHLILLCPGKTPFEKSIRTGLHSQFGVLGFWISCLFGILKWRMMMWMDLENANFDKECFYVLYCAIGYCICMWFIILNPYFDWRRLKTLWDGRVKEYDDLMT